MWYPIVITFLVGYFLGNINGAVFMSVLQGQDDVRSHGSGNAGLTNFIRNYGAIKGVVVVLIDFAKTALACLAGGLMFKSYGYSAEGMMLGAIASTLGHNFPVLLGFKGGKGIMCGISAAIVMDWRAALIIFAVFLVFYLFSDYVSLGSIAGAITYCITFGFFHWDEPLIAAGGIFLGLLALFMHRANIVRICKGTESKSPLFKKKKEMQK